ncbi:glycerate dehydrogenase [Pseudoalteromonas luteoviolacea]|uniref:Glycerate dehydrogenase n=1 Tax=Pseudoalteromonas luteoviolacea TaxID=43657 RepID=A0A1C0TPC3_9GAMM|nr:D-2-hydroxyacid dehydrogenase [Pseudoalteromonas luteoviolacea]OCQ20791.1 glycerate dehydrogenase [Pseudoalteromonas luteoviolacea]
MNIVVLDAATLAGADLSPLANFGTVTTYEHTVDEQIASRIQDANVIVSNKVQLNERHFAQAPQLKLICVAATGTNNIDLAAARTAGIAVTNVAGYSTPSVVQHTFTLLGNLMTNIHRYAEDCRNGAWQQSPMFCRLDHTITEIANKRFVIVGYGNLGQAVANVAKAFGAHVIVAERPNSKEVRRGRMAFEEALKVADIVSIHCPLTPQTENVFNADTLALLPKHAILINTARGGIVDEAALAKALSDKQLAAAGVDVLSTEPAQPDNPLIQYQGDNLLLTPHTAWASKESIDRLIAGIADNIDSYLNGGQTNRVI